MDSTRWQRIESIFQAALDEDPGPARDARVAELCTGDPTLDRQVRALLDEDVRLSQADDTLPDPHLGLRLGSFQIDTLIARGGMGSVYSGHRADETFDQRVAIKIMDVRLADHGLLDQFKAERQVLASLEHAAVSRLIDGGVTGQGAPYLVMEFIDGQPIDTYCDAHQLDVPSRLRLFAEICEGVAFAHDNLILHRDLKPSNVMVTAEGRAKIVDFGTAAFLRPDRLATISRAPLTPAYASPEQLLGRAVGTASDQYGLGLLLFDLLTGAHAFGHRTSLITSMERAMLGTPPPPMHAAVTEEAARLRHVSLSQLRRQLAGDLGTIVHKALASDPAGRYASVRHLADDLERCRQGQPILGRPPSVAYSAVKFVRRHGWAVAASATAAVLLLAAGVYSALQARAATAEALRAERQAVRAERVSRFLMNMLMSPSGRWTNTLRAKGVRVTLVDVVDELQGRLSTEFADYPDIEAELRRTIGDMYREIGKPDTARTQLLAARALQHRAVPGPSPLAGAVETGLAMLDYNTRAFDSAVERSRAALAILDAVGPSADKRVRIEAHQVLAVALRDLGRPVSVTLPHAEAVLALNLEINPRSASTAVAHAVVGWYNLRQGHLDLAEAGLRKALDIYLSDGPGGAAVLAGTYRDLADVALERGDAETANVLIDKATFTFERVFPANSFYVSWAYRLRGSIRAKLGRLREAEADFASAAERQTKSDWPNSLPLGEIYLRWGQARLESGAAARAEPLLRQGYDIIRKVYDPTDVRLAIAKNHLGECLLALGRPAEALSLLTDSVSTLVAANGPNHIWSRRAQAALTKAEAGLLSTKRIGSTKLAG